MQNAQVVLKDRNGFAIGLGRSSFSVWWFDSLQHGRTEIVPYQTVGFQNCHYGDDQLFQFDETSRQWQSVTTGQCLSISGTEAASIGSNESTAVAGDGWDETPPTIRVVLEDCVPISLSPSSTNTSLDPSVPEPILDTPQALATRNTNDDNSRDNTATSSLAVLDVNTTSPAKQQQQWYYDNNGMIYFFPDHVGTSYCMQVKTAQQQEQLPLHHPPRAHPRDKDKNSGSGS